jgi:alkylhydroperoxidase family enzyme
MRLIIQTPDSAPADSRPIMQAIAADLGLVPNLAATAATSPALLAGFDGLRRAVAATKLDPVLREVTGLAVGVAVDNRYGVAFHSTMLANLGLDEADIDALRKGQAPSDDAAAAAHRLAREVVLARGKVSDATITQATEAGIDLEAILEIVLESTFASLVGTVDNLANHVELDDFLAPRAWEG